MKISFEKDKQIVKMLSNWIGNSNLPFSPKDKRSTFEIFKSNICHCVKDLSDLVFVYAVLKSNFILDYWVEEAYSQSFYLLAMVDYLSRINNLPICSEYDEIRCYSFEKPVYPEGALVYNMVVKNSTILQEVENNAIPEFKQFNIIEGDIRNVS